jgi:hypothetical protein
MVAWASAAKADVSFPAYLTGKTAASVPLTNQCIPIVNAAGTATTKLCSNYATAIGAAALSANSPVYVTTAGAIGDGSSHPACTALGLANLTALQAYSKNGYSYSFATSCTNELDWLAAQAVINAGKDVFYPAGTYLNDQQIVLPNASEGPGTGAISIFGVSSSTSVLSWPTDLGTAKAGIVCGTPATSICAGTIQHLGMTGPAAAGYYATHLGSQVASMDGFLWGGRRQVNDLFITGFNKCISMRGDQTVLTALHTVNCTYGMYLDDPNSTNFGNIHIVKAILEQSSRAAIGMSHAAHLDYYTFESLCACVAPFGILKEMGGATDHPHITHGTVFINSQFENLGNGVIGDDVAGATRYGVDYESTWIETEFLWNATYRWSALNKDGIFNLYQSFLMKFNGFAEPGLWVPGTTGIFNIQFVTQAKMVGDCTTLRANAATASLPFSAFTQSSGQWVCEQPGQAALDVGQSFSTQYAFGNSGLPGYSGSYWVSSLAAASSASLQFTGLPTAYARLALNCTGLVPSIAGSGISVNVGEGGGPTWETTAHYTVLETHYGTTSTGSALGSKSLVATDAFNGWGGNLSTTVPLAFRMYIDNVASSSINKWLHWNLAVGDNDGSAWHADGKSFWNNDTNPITGIELVPSAGTIASGKCALSAIED